MKNLKGLVLRYIWKNKLRTIMTIISVMISAFIIYGIFSFGLNIFQNRMINNRNMVLYNPEMDDNSGLEEMFFTAMLMLVAGVFGLVVMVIIRNSFNISVSERENDYGMFRCIGLTRKQIIKMVLLEALIVGVIGTVIGILLGALGCSSLFSYINKYGENNLILKELLQNIGKLTFYFNWKAFGLTILFMAVIVGYSMVSPIEKLYKLSPVNALRSKDDVDKRTSAKLLRNRKSRVGKRPFGYAVWYGFKNVRLRKGRFSLLVMSLAVCFGVVLMVGCILKTVIRTELNNQMKPSLTIEGREPEENASYYTAWSLLGFSEIDELRDKLLVKKGFVDLGYSSVLSYNVRKEAGDEVKKRNLGKVSFSGVGEKYYDIIREEVGELNLSTEAGVVNVILFKGDIKKEDCLPNISTGDDIELYGTKLHIAGELSGVVFDQLADRKLPDMIAGRYAYYNFFYLKETDEPIISQEELEKDADNIYYSSELICIYVYADLEKDDGSIASYLSKHGYIYENNGIDIVSMKMIKGIIYFIVGVVLVIIMINLINVRTSEILLRGKELKLLRNIGFSSREIRSSVISEGLLVSICAVIVGAVLGVIAAFLMSKSIYVGHGVTGQFDSDTMSIRFGIDWTVFFVTAAAVFIINIVTGLIALAVVRKEYK